MALDAATLELTARELKTVLADAKIAKLFEPTRDELVITLRTRTDTYALLLSARSGSARVCLTEETFENPETPPSFCMLMRKHLTGGKLLDVHMEPGDRIVYFDFQCTNEMGDLVRNTLCAELMGRYSNLVLVQNGKIIDALKRVDFEDSDIRQLLPGLTYTTPPKPARPDFLQVSSASIVAAACQRDLPVADALNKTVAGVPGTVLGIAYILAFNTGFLVLTGTAAILVIVFVFRNMPVAIESGTTTLLQIDNSIEEASTILGAGSGYSFRRISLPMLRNAFFSGLVYSFVKAITAVSAIIFLVSPRWDLVTSKIYTLFDQAKYSQAAAFVTMMVVILLVFIGIFNGLINLLLAPRSRVPKGAGIHEKTEETK